MGSIFSQSLLRTPVYIIEGNIAVGKSSLLENLNPNKYNIIDEPMDKFCSLLLLDNNNINPLNLYYNNKISGFQFQIYLVSVFMNHTLNKIQKNKINILSRSLLSVIYCFGCLLYETKKINIIELSILKEYEQIFYKLTKNLNIKIIYLSARPEFCYERLLKRNREEEYKCDINYINRLHDIYGTFIEEINKKYQCYVINAENNPNVVYKDFLKIIK